MCGRLTDEEGHALLEPLGSSLPTEQTELLCLQHMDVLVLDDVRHLRLRWEYYAPIEYGGTALHAAAERLVALSC